MRSSARICAGIVALTAAILTAPQEADAVTVTAAQPPVKIKSLGDAGVYVLISGTLGQKVRVDVPVQSSRRVWLVEETMRLARWDGSLQKFVPVPGSRFDAQAGAVTADVIEDGVYGVFGAARAAHVADFQQAVCDVLASVTPVNRGNAYQRTLLRACRVYLCAEVDAAKWATVWSASTGYPMRPSQLRQYLEATCGLCSVRDLDPGDFPECQFLPQGELPVAYSKFVPFPCPDRARTCSDFDKDTVCDSWEICHGANPLAEDSDSDGLPDGEELDVGANPISADTDGDGLLDGWEVYGYDGDGDGTPEVDLAAMGVSPVKKDLLVEVVWLFQNDDNNGTLDPGEYSFEPSPDVITDAQEVFKNSPLKNPDGTTGVNLIVNVADEGVPMPANFGSTFWDVGVINGEEYPRFVQPFLDIRTAHPNQSLLKISRYSLWIESIAYIEGGEEVATTATGVTELIPGPNFVISLGWYRSTEPERLTDYAANANLSESEVLHDLELGTFLHELGHTLDLYHGGSLDPDCVIGNKKIERRYEPNYLSVMNYYHQIPGLDGEFHWGAPGNFDEWWPILQCASTATDDHPKRMCFKRGTNRVWKFRDFSSGASPPIDETKLDEQAGLPFVPGLNHSVDFNWDGSFVPGPGTSADLNDDGCDDQILTDHDDWSAMVFGFW